MVAHIAKIRGNSVVNAPAECTSIEKNAHLPKVKQSRVIYCIYIIQVS